jgi:hypothetical protein
MPELRGLLIDDDPAAWAAAGFEIHRGETDLGGIAVRFVAPTPTNADGEAATGPDQKQGRPGRGIVGWEMAGMADGSLDGIATSSASPSATDLETGHGGRHDSHPAVHPNGVTRLDHVVVTTPDMERTTAAFEQAGFEIRRTREIPGSQPLRLQRFIWAGEAILEVVGPAERAGEGPAGIWGLALTTADMDRAVSAIGAHLSPPKQAVQPGRRIATIDSKGLGMRTAVALMTPHVPVGDSRTGQG